MATTGPKYFWIVTFSDETTCRLDKATGVQGAIAAAESQHMRDDSRTIDRYLVANGKRNKRWTVKPPKKKKEPPNGSSQPT